MKNFSFLILITLAGLYSTQLQAQESFTKDLLARKPAGMKQITVQPSVAEATETQPAPEQPEAASKTPMDKLREAVGLKQPAYGINSTLTAKVPTYGKLAPEPETTDTGTKTEAQGQTKPLGQAKPDIPAHAAKAISGEFSELRQMDTSVAQALIDPLRIQLGDKRIIQLAGIDIPDFDAYDPGPVSVKVRDTLDSLLRGKQVRLYQSKDSKNGRVNRMGHELAHLVRVEDELWVQGSLLAMGLARVRPSERNPEMAAQMIALEDEARKEKLGLWADDKYAILTPETAAGHENGFVVVKGKVVNSSLVNNTLYVNFGSNWRNDFTISIKPAVRKAMASQGLNPQHLQGQTVRVRGWLESYNGPYIELIHPAWFEVLPEAGITPKVIHNRIN